MEYEKSPMSYIHDSPNIIRHKGDDECKTESQIENG